MDKNWQTVLLGLGLDCKDGHRRITRGENFYLFGGSKKTHSNMVDKSLAIQKELKYRCKRLEELTPEEWEDIAQKVRLYKREH